MQLRNWLLKLVCIFIYCSCSGCFSSTRHPQSAIEQARRLVDRSSLLLRVGDIEGAQAGFELALQNAPLVSAVDGLGCVALLRGEYTLAKQLFDRAIELDRNYAPAYFNLAMALEIEGQPSQALLLYQNGLALSPNDSRGRANYAALLADQAKLGNVSRDEAHREMQRARVLARTRLIKGNIEALEEVL